MATNENLRLRAINEALEQVRATQDLLYEAQTAEMTITECGGIQNAGCRPNPEGRPLRVHGRTQRHDPTAEVAAHTTRLVPRE